MHLTGIPAENIQHNEIKYFQNGCWNTNTDKADLFWDKLVEALERNYTVIGDSKTINELEPASNIEPERDYLILDAVTLQLNKTQGQSIRLLRLQNKYSTREWA